MLVAVAAVWLLAQSPVLAESCADANDFGLCGSADDWRTIFDVQEMCNLQVFPCSSGQVTPPDNLNSSAAQYVQLPSVFLSEKLQIRLYKDPYHPPTQGSVRVYIHLDECAYGTAPTCTPDICTPPTQPDPLTSACAVEIFEEIPASAIKSVGTSATDQWHTLFLNHGSLPQNGDNFWIVARSSPSDPLNGIVRWAATSGDAFDSSDDGMSNGASDTIKGISATTWNTGTYEDADLHFRLRRAAGRDLQLEPVSLSWGNFPDPPDPGDQVDIEVTVTNSGTIDLGSGEARLRVSLDETCCPASTAPGCSCDCQIGINENPDNDGESACDISAGEGCCLLYVQEIDLPALAAGNQFQHTFTYITGGECTVNPHEFLARVDSCNSVDEADESNNTDTFTVTASTNRSPLVTGVSVSPSQVEADGDDPQCANCFLTFNGSAVDDGTVVEYRFYSDREGADSICTTSTLPCTRTTEDLQASLSGTGGTTHTVTMVAVDDKGKASEPGPLASPPTFTITYLGTKPEITRLYSVPDGDASSSSIGTFLSFTNAPMGFTAPTVNVNFRTDVQDDDNNVGTVEFTPTQGAFSDFGFDISAPFSYTFNVSDFPGGSVDMETLATDTTSKTDLRTMPVTMVQPPDWLYSDFVSIVNADWDSNLSRYNLEVKIPANPDLDYSKNFTVPYLGTLENRFAVFVEVPTTYNINNTFALQAIGRRIIKILGFDVDNTSFTITPLYSFVGTDNPLSTLDFQLPTLPLISQEVTVVDGANIGSFVVAGVVINIVLSVDIGFESWLDIGGTVNTQDLTVQRIEVTPTLSPSLTIDLAAEIYGGAATIGFRTTPTLGYAQPIVYEETHDPKLYLDNPCLSFVIYMEVYGSVLWGLVEGTLCESCTAENMDPTACGTDVCDEGASFCNRIRGGRSAEGGGAGGAPDPVPDIVRPTVATNNVGDAIVAWTHDIDLGPSRDPDLYFALDSPTLGQVGPLPFYPPATPGAERYETDPQLAFYTPQTVLAVWTENDMSQADAAMIPPGSELQTALDHQDLRWATLDVTNMSLPWSSAMPLIDETALPAMPCGMGGRCPDGSVAVAGNGNSIAPQALALWVHDNNGAGSAGGFEIHYAHWSNASGGMPNPPGGALLAAPVGNGIYTEPAVAFSPADPSHAVAVWTSDTDGDPTTNSDRTLAYAIWNGTAWQDRDPITPGDQIVGFLATSYPAGLAGVVQPSIAFIGDTPVAAFVRRGADSDQLTGDVGEGTQGEVWSAMGSPVAPMGQIEDYGWTLETVTQGGRDPQVAYLDSDGKAYAYIAYRAVSGGHNAGTQDRPGPDGEICLASQAVDEGAGAGSGWGTGQNVDPNADTDTVTDWLAAVAFDSSGRLRVAWHRPGGSGSTFGTEYDDIQSLNFEPYRDRAILELTTSNSYPDPGEVVTLTATVKNLGSLEVLQSFESEGPFDITFSFDDGTMPVTQNVGSLEPLEDKTFMTNWTATAGEHTVTATLTFGDPPGTSPDRDPANDLLDVVMGKPPAPQLLSASTVSQGVVQLNWQLDPGMDRSRVNGYRIYRGPGDGSGSTQQILYAYTTGAVDQAASLPLDYRYEVSVVDDQAVESERSDAAVIQEPGGPYDTTTTLASTDSQSVTGQSIDLIATVQSTSAASSHPSGSVDFLEDGTTLLGSATLDGVGQARLTLSNLTVGSHALSADYSPDMGFNGSTGNHTQDVIQADTTVAVVSDNNPAALGETINFTATVTVIAPGAGLPTGDVTFRDGGSPIGTAAVDGSGQAVLSTSVLGEGPHVISADYNGDFDYNLSSGQLAPDQSVLLLPASLDMTLLPAGEPDTQLMWNADPNATAYDVVEGDLILLRGSGGDFATATTNCAANDQAATTMTVSAPLTAGEIRWYLVRGLNGAGNGTYDSSGIGQAAPRDAAVDAAAPACP
jgi:fibronectin type 3 domain-containing protein